MDLFKSIAFDARVNSIISDWHVPGLAIAIVQNDTVASKAWGSANLEHATPFTTDTLCDMASTSKSLTAASVALLIDDNNAHPFVQWDSTMSSLLPNDFVLSEDEYTKTVTAEDILSHRSGLPRHDFSHLGIYSDRPDTPRSVTQNLRYLEMAAPVRSKFLYSNVMYIVASHLVEQISGLAFGEYLKEYFFGPLGMNSTYLQPQSAIDAGLQDRLATPYNWNEERQSYTTIKYMQVPEAQGCGSIFTSVNDYIKWIKAMMNQEAPISKPIYNGLVKPRIISEDPTDGVPEWGEHASPAFYAAGWEVIYYHGYQFMLHNGVVSGFGSFHFFLPDVNFGGVVMGNSAWAALAGTRLCAELISEALDVCPLDDFPKWNEIAKLMNEQEEQQAKELRQDLCPGIDNPEPQKKPLSEYIGRYWNAGYRSMNVEVQDGQLFVNATDRSEAFTLTFEHLCKQTKYVAQMIDWYDGDKAEMAAEFVYRGDEIVRMGLRLEDELDHPIWFEKQSDRPRADNFFARYDADPLQVILSDDSLWIGF